MKISAKQNKNRNLPSFIRLHLSWPGLTETPEWKSFKQAWTAGECQVSATALDVIRSHYRDQLSRSERGLLCGISDALFSAVRGAVQAA